MRGFAQGFFTVVGIFLLLSSCSSYGNWQVPDTKPPSLKTTMNQACGQFAPAVGWDFDNSDGPGPLYTVYCRQGVTLTAPGP